MSSILTGYFKIDYLNEDKLTIAVANYLRMQYPKVLFTHIANERQTSPKRGAKFKKMGVRKGMPDIMVFKSKKGIPGLAIELKIKPNKPTESQIEVLEALEGENWITDICYDFDTAKQTIDNYLN